MTNKTKQEFEWEAHQQFLSEEMLSTQRLHIAILAQAIRDANMTSQKKYNGFIKKEARRFICNQSPHFMEVCSIAGVSPKLVITAMNNKVMNFEELFLSKC